MTRTRHIDRYVSAILDRKHHVDQVLAQQWGPHPLAKPTRRSLFAEPHPDPTAGVATSWEPIAQKATPLFDTVLEDPALFEEAHWLANLPISDEQCDVFFRLPRVSYDAAGA
jgi:hypothetical protein